MPDPFTQYEEAQFALLSAMGIEANADNLEHLRELLDVMAIYAERNAKYQGVWRQYGALSNLVRGAQKVDRTMAVWWFEQGEELPPALDLANLDDAVDAINHLLFFVRCAKAGNLTGKPAERPEDMNEKLRQGWQDIKEAWAGAMAKLRDAGLDVDAIAKTGTGNVVAMRPKVRILDTCPGCGAETGMDHGVGCGTGEDGRPFHG